MTKCRIEDVYMALRSVEQELAIEGLRYEGTPVRIANLIHMAEANVRKNLKKLKAQDRAHVVRWTERHPVSNGMSTIWAIGPGEDAPRPKPKREKKRRPYAYTDVMRERRQAARANEGAGRRATYACIERVKQAPQTWFSALEAA